MDVKNVVEDEGEDVLIESSIDGGDGEGGGGGGGAGGMVVEDRVRFALKGGS